MEMNDIEKARANREIEKFFSVNGIDKSKPIHEQLTNAIHDGSIKQAKCCEGECKGHSSKDLT